MILRQPPDPVKHFLRRMTCLFDQRHAELVEPLFLGELLADGRRTATTWFGRACQWRSESEPLWRPGRATLEPRLRTCVSPQTPSATSEGRLWRNACWGRAWLTSRRDSGSLPDRYRQPHAGIAVVLTLASQKDAFARETGMIRD